MAARGVVCVALTISIVSGCAGRADRELEHASVQLGRAVATGKASSIGPWLAAGQLALVDMNATVASREAIAEDLETAHARATPLIVLGEGHVEALESVDGRTYRFQFDPTDYYGRETPRRALSSFVRSTRLGRWDVVLTLAPRRFRAALTEAALKHAWSDNESGAALRTARDRLAACLDAPVRADAHHAVLVCNGSELATLEREGDGWVVVDF